MAKMKTFELEQLSEVERMDLKRGYGEPVVVIKEAGVGGCYINTALVDLAEVSAGDRVSIYEHDGCAILVFRDALSNAGFCLTKKTQSRGFGFASSAAARVLSAGAYYFVEKVKVGNMDGYLMERREASEG